MIISLFTVSMVHALGEQCNNQTSLWEKEACKVIQKPDKFQLKCIPQRLIPDTIHNDEASIKGVILLYHGFTACPDSFTQITQVLRSQGYITLTPLLPGHGINLGYQCDQKSKCVYNSTNPSFLPINKREYIDWADWSIDMLKEEVALVPMRARDAAFFVGVLGLSAGGPLGLYAASLPSSPVNKLIIVNPWLAFTYKILDFKVKVCESAEKPELCTTSNIQSTINGTGDIALDHGNNTRSIFSALSSIRNVASGLSQILSENTIGKMLAYKYDVVFLALLKAMTAIGDSWSNHLVNLQGSWGNACTEDLERGGLCGCRLRNIFALQAFAEFAVAQIDLIHKDVSVDIIQSDTDGPIADSISHAVMTSLSSRGIISSKCKFLLKCAINDLTFDDNRCGAPHSIFSHAENIRTPPYNLFWEASLFDNILNVYNKNGSRVGLVGNNDTNICTATSKTMGYGVLFDNFGPKYLQKAIARYN